MKLAIIIYICIFNQQELFRFAGAVEHEADSLPSIIDEFENVIQFLTLAAIEQFEQHPDELEEVLKEFSREISSGTFDVIQITIKNQNSFDASEIAMRVSQAFENALTTVQRSQRKIIDIDSIVLSIYLHLEKILNQSIAQENQSFMLNDKLQDLFSDIFLSGLFEPISDIQQSKKQYNKEQIIQSLQEKDINEATDKIIEFLLNQEETKITQLILSIIDDKQLESILLPTMVQLYGQINVNNDENEAVIKALSTALGAAYNDASQQIVFFLTKIILKLQNYNKNSAIIHALAHAFSQKGPITELFQQSLALAILQEGCTSVAQLLMDAKKLNSKNIKNFTENVKSNKQISKCMQIADELEVTVRILSMLDEPEEAFYLVLNAFKNRQDAAIAMSLIRGVDAGQENEVVLLLSLMFMEEEIQTSQLSLVLSLALSQGEKNVARIILSGIGQLKMKNQLVKIAKAVNFAFEKGTEDVKNAFEFLLEQSVRFEICGLRNVLKEAFLIGDAEMLLNVLTANPMLSVCIEQEFYEIVDKQLAPQQENLVMQSKNIVAISPLQENIPVLLQPSINDTDQLVDTLDFSLAPVYETENNVSKNVNTFDKIIFNQETVQEFLTAPNNEDQDSDQISVNLQNSQIPGQNASSQVYKQEQLLTTNISLGGDISVTNISNPQLDANQNQSPILQHFVNINNVQNGNSEDCADIQPIGEFTCQKQVEWQKCDAEWMITGQFCRKSCGFCDSKPDINQLVVDMYPQTVDSQFPIKDLQPIIDKITAKASSGDVNNAMEPVNCELDQDLLVRIAEQAVSEVVLQSQKQ
eukprot:TRINITY_DN394_c0_g2_i9.p1 TRINITY_DN394_c0_g2~~TRINITY_DN394_c0_g2_i9.p1  ORF type:complete len:814 (+),score=146.92 TRINITY_DN394_c0_g2_i9:138-2579(+)